MPRYLLIYYKKSFVKKYVFLLDLTLSWHMRGEGGIIEPSSGFSNNVLRKKINAFLSQLSCQTSLKMYRKNLPPSANIATFTRVKSSK